MITVGDLLRSLLVAPETSTPLMTTGEATVIAIATQDQTQRKVYNQTLAGFHLYYPHCAVADSKQLKQKVTVI